MSVAVKRILWVSFFSVDLFGNGKTVVTLSFKKAERLQLHCASLVIDGAKGTRQGSIASGGELDF